MPSNADSATCAKCGTWHLRHEWIATGKPCLDEHGVCPGCATATPAEAAKHDAIAALAALRAPAAKKAVVKKAVVKKAVVKKGGQ
jgi:hypothetical protein